MAIFGVGVDLIDIKRFAGDNFDAIAVRILTENEHAEWLNVAKKDVFLAKKFAVKEAVSKSLGTGIGKMLSFKDVEISHNEFGKPLCKISLSVLHKITGGRNADVHISLSDTESSVIAYAITELV